MKLNTIQNNFFFSVTDNTQTKEMVKNQLKEILESNLSPYQKADTITSMLLDIESKLSYIKERINLLNSIKKRLEKSKDIAKSIVAECMQEYGIDRLDGVEISSITLIPQKEEVKEHIKVLDPQALINLGYAKVDEKKLKQDLYTDNYNKIAPFIEIEVENIQKPASIRLNKRKIYTPSIEN